MLTGPKNYDTQMAHVECEKHVVLLVYLSFVIKAEIQRTNSPLYEKHSVSTISAYCSLTSVLERQQGIGRLTKRRLCAPPRLSDMQHLSMLP